MIPPIPGDRGIAPTTDNGVLFLKNICGMVGVLKLGKEAGNHE
jgi:hypothetical protein